MKFNESGWYQMRMFDKTASKDVLFGPAKQIEHTSYIYPKETIQKDETVIWSPVDHKTVSLKSYEKAHKTCDQEALAKISRAGIPLGCTFGGLLNLSSKS